MNMSRIKNRIKQQLYKPGKSKIISSSNLTTFRDIEDALDRTLSRIKKKDEEKEEEKD